MNIVEQGRFNCIIGVVGNGMNTDGSQSICRAVTDFGNENGMAIINGLQNHGHGGFAAPVAMTVVFNLALLEQQALPLINSVNVEPFGMAKVLIDRNAIFAGYGQFEQCVTHAR